MPNRLLKDALQAVLLPISTATQAALDAKAALDSPALTGNPTAPTAAPSNNSTRIANTAFVETAKAAAIARANHTGTQLAATISDFQAKVIQFAPGGVASTDAATLQGSDKAFILARVNHAGTQTASTISDFQSKVVEFAPGGTFPNITEVANFAALPVTGNSALLYLTLNDNAQYRWTGTQYINYGTGSGSADVTTADNFNRANGDAGVNWTSFGAASTLTVTTNQAVLAGTVSQLKGRKFAGTSVDAIAEAEYISGSQFAVALRIQADGACYTAGANTIAGYASIQQWTAGLGTPVTIGTQATYALVAGDRLRLRVRGKVLTFSYIRGGVETILVQQYYTGIETAGATGVFTESASTVFDNFSFTSLGTASDVKYLSDNSILISSETHLFEQSLVARNTASPKTLVVLSPIPVTRNLGGNQYLNAIVKGNGKFVLAASVRFDWFGYIDALPNHHVFDVSAAGSEVHFGYSPMADYHVMWFGARDDFYTDKANNIYNATPTDNLIFFDKATKASGHSTVSPYGHAKRGRTMHIPANSDFYLSNTFFMNGLFLNVKGAHAGKGGISSYSSNLHVPAGINGVRITGCDGTFERFTVNGKKPNSFVDNFSVPGAIGAGYEAIVSAGFASAPTGNVAGGVLTITGASDGLSKGYVRTLPGRQSQSVVRYVSGGSLGLICRLQANGDCYWAELVSGQSVKLYRRTGGVNTLISAGNVHTLIPNAVYHFDVINAQMIVGYIEDTVSAGYLLNDYDFNLTNPIEAMLNSSGKSGFFTRGTTLTIDSTEIQTGTLELNELASGFRIESHCIVKDVSAVGFEGHGLFLLGGGGIGDNANSATVENVGGFNCNGYGVRLYGNDANNVVVRQADVRGNIMGGVAAEQFLDAKVEICHASANRGPQYYSSYNHFFNNTIFDTCYLEENEYPAILGRGGHAFGGTLARFATNPVHFTSKGIVSNVSNSQIIWSLPNADATLAASRPTIGFGGFGGDGLLARAEISSSHPVSFTKRLYPTDGVTISNGLIVGTGNFSTNGGDASIAGKITSTGGVVNRVGIVGSGAVLTPQLHTDDWLVITALAINTTIPAPVGGTPYDTQSLTIRIKDNGTSRTITWNAIYRPIGVTLPTATTPNKTMYITTAYNAIDNKWDVLDVKIEV